MRSIRNIAGREHKSILRISIYYSKNLSMIQSANVINLPPKIWLIPQVNGAILCTLCWSLLLENWILNGDDSQLGLGE
jgi:hypothetical protein